METTMVGLTDAELDRLVPFRVGDVAWSVSHFTYHDQTRPCTSCNAEGGATIPGTKVWVECQACEGTAAEPAPDDIAVWILHEPVAEVNATVRSCAPGKWKRSIRWTAERARDTDVDEFFDSKEAAERFVDAWRLREPKIFRIICEREVAWERGVTESTLELPPIV